MDNVKPAGRTVNISDQVIRRVAALAALDVEGVARLSGGSFLHDPVEIENIGGAISVKLTIIVQSGSRAVNVARQVQNAVKHSIQDMTGVTALGVNVTVGGMEAEV